MNEDKGVFDFEERVYEIGSNGRVQDFEIIPISQHPIYKRMRALQEEKIKEIKNIMEKYGIDIADLEDDDEGEDYDD